MTEVDTPRRRASDRAFLSVAEMAEELGVSAVTVYRWINDGRVEAIENPLSDRTVISRNEVERIRPFVKPRS
jgi:predicted site-specific integrase-resolvase